MGELGNPPQLQASAESD